MIVQRLASCWRCVGVYWWGRVSGWVAVVVGSLNTTATLPAPATADTTLCATCRTAASMCCTARTQMAA